MKFTHRARQLTLSLALIIASSLGVATGVHSAEPSRYEVKSGPYTVYYSLFPSTFITPDVASAYNIKRGKNNAVLNVSVRKDLPEGGDREQPAQVSGISSDLIHRTPLPFTEIRERGAVYYLAQITVTGSPLLYFELTVQPEPDAAAIPISFKQQLFAQ